MSSDKRDVYEPYKSPEVHKGRLKEFGIHKEKVGGYEPFYVDLDGWKLGYDAPMHREPGQRLKRKPDPVKPPDGKEGSTYFENAPYNRHAENDWIAREFKGLHKKHRNYTVSIMQHQRNQRLSMSEIANIQQRRRKVAQLLLEGGYSQRQMAEIIGVSDTTIHRDIQALDTIWREEMAQSVDTYRNRLIKRLEYVLRESKDAWERSKLEKRKEKKKLAKGKKQKGKKGNQKVEELTITTEDRIGDPRHLENFQDAAVNIAAFQGVDQNQLTKFEINILPPLPEEKFGRYGIKSGDYGGGDQDLDAVKEGMNTAYRLQAISEKRAQKQAKAEEAEFEDLPESDEEE